MRNDLLTHQRLPDTLITSTLQRGILAQRAGDFSGAEFHYQSVLRDYPKNSDALNLMGTIALEAKKPDIATVYFRKALKLRPHEPIFLYNLGSAQFLDGKARTAIKTLRKAARAKPNHAKTWALLGRAEAALGQHKAALKSYDRALLQDPNDIPLNVERAEMLVKCGQMDEAAEVFREAIAKGETVVRSMVGLSIAIKFSPVDPEPALMVEWLQRDDLNPSERETLRYAAGKALADQKEYDSAFRQFATAKAEAKSEFGIELHRAALERTKSQFTANFIAERQRLGSPSDRPIFIVGMPRSGTTLTEQICASHPQIAGAGELPTIRGIASQLGLGDHDRTAYLRNVAALTEGEARRHANNYLAALKQYSQSARRVVDKMPHNYELLGLIAILFPNAKIIHCKRNAMDTCVSCFTHNFSSAHGYNGDLKTLGLYYCAYDDLMLHWKKVLPKAFLDSSYEDLISNQEGASRRIIEWTGLEWDNACLAFDKTERVVTTPSRWQVRQPIYKTSVRSWKKYASHLDPLRESLGALAKN